MSAERLHGCWFFRPSSHPVKQRTFNRSARLSRLHRRRFLPQRAAPSSSVGNGEWDRDVLSFNIRSKRTGKESVDLNDDTLEVKIDALSVNDEAFSVEVDALSLNLSLRLVISCS
jgi:hypothetical protein